MKPVAEAATPTAMQSYAVHAVQGVYTGETLVFWFEYDVKSPWLVQTDKLPLAESEGTSDVHLKGFWIGFFFKHQACLHQIFSVNFINSMWRKLGYLFQNHIADPKQDITMAK